MNPPYVIKGSLTNKFTTKDLEFIPKYEYHKRMYIIDNIYAVDLIIHTLNEMPSECDISSKSSSIAVDATWITQEQGFSPSIHAITSEFGSFGSQSSYMVSKRNTNIGKSSHSSKQLSSFNASILASGGGPPLGSGIGYPTINQ